MDKLDLIPIEKIKPNQYQPRTHFDEDALFDLAQSIRENGLIQPIVVRADGEGYEIIAGERRYRAMMMIGKTEVPCIIADANDQKSATLALIENIQREDLSPVEEAKAFREILRLEGLTQKELANRLGKSQSSIANKLRLLELPQTVLLALDDRKITERHARAMIGLEVEKSEKILDKILEEKLNVRQTEELIDKPKKKKRKPILKGISQNIKIGINTINQSIKMIEKTGIPVNHALKETDDEVVIEIRFPKT